MNNEQPANPLHGITLEMILTQLVDEYGWVELGSIIDSDALIMSPASSPV
jgi:uncharacterized protein (DUF2132 family)